MKRKAANNEGSVYRLAGGRWQASVSVRGANGKLRRVTRTCPTKREATRKLHELLALRDRGELVPTSRQTVGDYLTAWLENTKRPEVRPHTHETYLGRCAHIRRLLGGVQLRNLTVGHVEMLRASMGKEGYAAGTINAVLRTLKTALNDAIRHDLLAVNVCTRVRCVSDAGPDRATLGLEHVPALLTHLDGTEDQALFALLIFTGLRVGEALALTWDDVSDTEVRISKTITQGKATTGFFIGPPKTRSSNRSVPLPASLVSTLKRHRALVTTRQLATRGWVDGNRVFPGQRGGIMDPATVRSHLRHALTAIGAPDMTTHALRHTCATYHAQIGTPAEVTQRILGHSSVAMTMDVYTHVQRERLTEAAARMAALMEEMLAC